MAKYIMITPVKNEAKHIRQTIESVLDQKTLPELWAIIDGGSTDKTREIIQGYADRHPWIHIRRQLLFSDKGGHTNVSIAANEAYGWAKQFCEGIKGIAYDYIWTVDGDQTISPDVCGGIIRFLDLEYNKKVGAASGQVYNSDGSPDTYPDGELPNKRVYRKEAIEGIGGFPVTKYSYDTVILAKLRMAGWEIRSYPVYRIQNLRDDSGIERNAWKSAVQFGRARYYLGYSFLLLVLGCGYLVLQKKPVKSLGVFWGYVASWVNWDERIPDPAIINHFGRERVNEVLDSVWITPKHIAGLVIGAGIFIGILLVWRYYF